MKIDWLYFIIYLFFVFILAIGLGSMFCNFNIGLITFAVGGLIYLFINTVTKYLDCNE